MLRVVKVQILQFISGDIERVQPSTIISDSLELGGVRVFFSKSAMCHRK